MNSIKQMVTEIPLAEVALNAAIELDMKCDQTIWLDRLANALQSKEAFIDATLFPAYDRALASATGKTFRSKSDVYSKLTEYARRLARSEENEADTLRNFCLALHDALLNQQYDRHRTTVLSTRDYV